MAQELTIVKTDNGNYIIKILDPVAQRQSLFALTNFGAVVKEARQLFDESIVRKDFEPEAAQAAE